jgi:hypothetical protein
MGAVLDIVRRPIARRGVVISLVEQRVECREDQSLFLSANVLDMGDLLRRRDRR